MMYVCWDKILFKCPCLALVSVSKKLKPGLLTLSNWLLTVKNKSTMNNFKILVLKCLLFLNLKIYNKHMVATLNNLFSIQYIRNPKVIIFYSSCTLLFTSLMISVHLSITIIITIQKYLSHSLSIIHMHNNKEYD